MAYSIYNPEEKKKLQDNIDLTFSHTKKVLDNLSLFLYQPDEFNRTHKVEIPNIEFNNYDTAYKYLPLLTYLHDFYKIFESRNHAFEGYNFLEDISNRKLIEFHDIFGIINTGEASLLFLDNLFEFIIRIKENQAVEEFLNKLFVLTVVDVASYGYLNQSRIEIFSYIKEKLLNSKSFEDFEKIAKEDTPKRIIRLLKANNRIDIPPNIEKHISTIMMEHEFVNLQQNLLSSRFDAGIYVLEPLFRKLCDIEYKISNKEILELKDVHIKKVNTFLTHLTKIFKKEKLNPIKTLNGVDLVLIDFNHVSIKGDKNLDIFEAWVKTL